MRYFHAEGNETGVVHYSIFRYLTTDSTDKIMQLNGRAICVFLCQCTSLWYLKNHLSQSAPALKAGYWLSSYPGIKFHPPFELCFHLHLLLYFGGEWNQDQFIKISHTFQIGTVDKHTLFQFSVNPLLWYTKGHAKGNLF